ncbi:MAG: ribonuclease H [Bacteroidota bacterium]
MSFYAEIYTDGSCHTQHCIGAWAAAVLIDGKKVMLSGKCENTTHNRMEILAVINAIKHVLQDQKNVTEIKIVSDSQYVIGLISRQVKFESSGFKTKAGDAIRNVDLVKELLDLVTKVKVQFVKIKAHQKPTDDVNYNIVVDKLARQIVRDAVKTIF